MKLNKYLALTAIASMFAFTACEEDPITPADPTVAITGTPSFIIPVTQFNNQTVSFEFTVDAPGKIKELKIVRTYYLGENQVGDAVSSPYNVAIGGTTFTETFTDDVISGNFHLGTVDLVEFMVVVTDDNDNIADAIYEVTMGAYTALTTEKSGQIWKIHGSGNGSWNLKDDAVVSSTLTDEASIANRYIINSDNVNTNTTDANFTGSWTSNSVEWTSTGGTNYTTAGNGTLYVKANSYNYTTAKKEVAQYMFSIGTQSTDVSNPVVGDIFIGKKGDELYVIKITEFDIAATPAKLNTGVLRFTYKK